VPINAVSDTNLIFDFSTLSLTGRDPVPRDTEITIVINNTPQKFANPVSAKECGNWKVTTYNVFDGKEYMVDTATAGSNLQFIATNGLLSGEKVAIKGLTNNY